MWCVVWCMWVVHVWVWCECGVVWVVCVHNRRKVNRANHVHRSSRLFSQTPCTLMRAYTTHTHTHICFRHTYKHKAYIVASNVTKVRAFPKASKMGSTAMIFFANITLPSAQPVATLVSGCGVVMVWRYSCRRVCLCDVYMLNRWAFLDQKVYSSR